MRKASRAASFNSIRPIPPTAPLEAAGIHESCAQELPMCGRAYSYHEPAKTSRQVWSARLIQFARGFIMPVSLAVIFSIPCALIPALKALFIETPGWTGTRMPSAPDGRPPLAWVLDTAIFIGGIVIPAGLLLLGAGFARIKVRAGLTRLTVGCVQAQRATSGRDDCEWSAESAESGDGNGQDGHHADYRGVFRPKPAKHLPTRGS